MRGALVVDIRRMFRSVHWIGTVALKTTLMLAAIGIVLLVEGLWLPGAIALAMAPVMPLAWLLLFRRAEDHGKVAKAEENFRQDWQWLREAGPLKRAGSIAVIVLAVVSVVILNYLQRRWELPPYGP
ncbi:MAG: hypothetical protein QOG43_1291 [Actinomycetota bacterium]|jgi:hypothetical protein|nr:hypothetical protein [Actinomycetota bacterium]